ncbi:uncharacterized protein B0T15DRAFT_10310 [Chaetomium strumarium]|uniref:C3H1-type domain-containing protein n=1 Tax=Chaetomium strumarium TaxID=1170767 RepID=A0AAJ0H0N8_9PEZI|nr:hypothetical protein B0T15DRAFT_10310 [Chaetomium strumarium]
MVPRPQFFVVRPDTKTSSADGRVYTVHGAIVPLVAVDELPEWLDLVGVPRGLTAKQTVGLYNLGTVSKGDGSYAVNIHRASTAGSAARDSSIAMNNMEAKQAEYATVNAPSTSSPSGVKAPSVAAAATTHAHPADNMKAHWSEAHARALAISNNTAQQQPQAPLLPPTSSPPAQPPLPGDPAKPTTMTTTTSTAGNATPEPGATTAASTEYCRHWCHHGTCRWGPRCRYLHAMPTTRAELAEIGLSEIPAWWRIATGTATAGLPSTSLSSHPGNAITTSTTPQPSGLGRLAGGHSASGDGNGNGNGGYDPRDVRAGVMRLLSPGAGVGTGAVVGLGRGSNNSNRRAAKAQTQLRETVALLRELGLALGGGGGRVARNRREVNPLEKGRGKGVVGEEKETILKAAKAEGWLAASIHSASPTAAGAAAGRAGQVQTRGVVAAQENAVGVSKREGGQTAVVAAQTAGAATKVGKLVDV